MKHETGELKELTFAELKDCVERVELHPEFFLDVQSETLDAFMGPEPFAQIAVATASVMADHPEYLPAGITPEMLTMEMKASITVAMLVRLHACEQVSDCDWMRNVWLEAMVNARVLPAMAKHFCKAELHYNEVRKTLVFDEQLAKAALASFLE
jgi:hypothetical protein